LDREFIIKKREKKRKKNNNFTFFAGSSKSVFERIASALRIKSILAVPWISIVSILM